MPVLNMAPTLGDLLKYELNANFSRETITLKSGTAYAVGFGARQDHGSGQVPTVACRPGRRRRGRRDRGRGLARGRRRYGW